MTAYETLCCFKSPAWYQYRNLLSVAYGSAPNKIEQDLPKEVIDSYLGRLITIAKHLNTSWPAVTNETLPSYMATLQMFTQTKVFTARTWNTRMKTRVSQFLDYGLPAAWLAPVIDPFLIELWAEKTPSSDFNRPAYYEAIKTLSTSTFPALVAWLQLHPEYLNEETRYVEEDVACPSQEVFSRQD